MLGAAGLALPTEIIWWQLASYAVALAWGEFMVGCLGVGGAALATSLLLNLPGMTPARAAGSVFLGLVPVSMARMAQLLYFRRLALCKALPLMLGAAMGGLPGQLLLPHLPSRAAALLLAAVAIWAAGIRGFLDRLRIVQTSSQQGLEAALEEAAVASCRSPVLSLARPTSTRMERRLQSLFKAGVGLVVAFVSSLSGTGGALVLLPLAMLLEPEMDMRSLLGISMPFAATTVASSALGALLLGNVDWGVSAVIGGMGMVFCLLGGLVMESMEGQQLKSGIGAALVVVSLAVTVLTGIAEVTA